MNTGMEGARADDTGTVKPRILSWTAEEATATVVTTASSKVTRGFADPVTGMLLLPLEYKDKEKYPKYVLLMRDSHILIYLLTVPWG